jgi:hypothetical protein
MTNEYVICIPSYKRPDGCNNKTLTTLSENGISSKLIYVYVANKEEYDIYEQHLDKNKYNKLVVGKIGIGPQRQFIVSDWPVNTHIVSLDDDIEKIDLSLSPLFKKHSLDYFIKYAFNECIKQHSFIWGVYAVYNPFFRKPRPELSTGLNFIVGCFYGFINRPNLKSVMLKVTNKTGEKDDVERSILYFINDGIILRFNKIGFVTKYYGTTGGLGVFSKRLITMKEAGENLYKKYSNYGHIKVRKNGMTEFVLKKLPSFDPNNKSVKQRKLGNSKTRKNKN